MSVSIIIPTLDRHRELKNVIEKVYTWQSKPEIIVIDQSQPSTLSTPNYTSTDERIKHIYVDFVGVCRARNYGASLASHDILFFLDDDVDPDPNDDLADFVIQHFRKYPNSVLTGAAKGNVFTSKKTERFDVLIQMTSDIPVFFEGDYRLMLPVDAGIMAIPKWIYDYLDGFDELFDPAGFEDRDFGLRCYFHGVPVYRHLKFEVLHLGAPSGGRRNNSQDWRNRHYLWSKYLPEDFYFLQSFVYWLTQPGKKKRWIRHFIEWFVKIQLRPPRYPR